MRYRNQFDNELDQVNYELALMKSHYPPQRIEPANQVLPGEDVDDDEVSEEEEEDGGPFVKKKKDKKLVFLSRSVL